MEKLFELVKFEQGILNHSVSHDIDIRLNHKLPSPFTHRSILNIQVTVTCGGKEFNTKMDQVFIHQIGKRIYGDSIGNDYYPLFQKWVIDLNDDTQSFLERIRKAFIDNKLIIRYYHVNSQNMIYGVVSGKYEPTSQIDFRNKFIEIAQKSPYINVDKTTMYSTHSGPRGTVKEYFDFSTPHSNVSLKCGIVYGLNNGYGAYSIHWTRIIEESKTWLSPWKSEQDFKWRNNPRFHDESSNIEMKRFVDFIVSEGLKHGEYINNIVQKSYTKNIIYNDLEHFMSLMRIAQATKDRIKKHYFEESILSKGNTLFSFSESIRYVGTHDNYTGKATKRLLIEVGTTILEEEGLEAKIKAGVDIALTGTYEWY